MTSWIYTPDDAGSKNLDFFMTSLRFLLAAFFIFAATKNLLGDETMAADFRRFGYSNWFRIATATLQIIGALLLLRMPIAFFGGSLLTCVLVGAVWSHFRHDPPMSMLAPAAFLLPAIAIMWHYRPPALR